MKIKKCRICLSPELAFIGTLGKIAVSNFTQKPIKGTKFYLSLVYCPRCGLLQLDRNINRALLYKHYWYQSHLNPVIVSDLQDIAKLSRGTHIDIGANDGTLLAAIPKATRKIAVDPSDIQPNGFDWIQDYWENVRLPFRADTITAIACLYDLPTPNKFLANIKRHLAPEGVFITQLMTLQPMIENNDLGNICHEHIEYYSYVSLVYLFEKNGLEIYKVEKNTINGGSYRIFARHYRKGSISFEEHRYTIADLRDWFFRLVHIRDQFRALLKEKDLALYGYGASTKANTILQFYGVKPKAIVDINSSKVGKFTIATQIPIIDKIPEDAELLWVFPYGFIDYFKLKETAYQGKWITTIPELKFL